MTMLVSSIVAAMKETYLILLYVVVCSARILHVNFNRCKRDEEKMDRHSKLNDISV